MPSSCAKEGERDALTRRLQDRCQNILAPGGRILREKFSSRNENPHGFEFPRTVWCRREIVSFLGFWLLKLSQVREAINGFDAEIGFDA